MIAQIKAVLTLKRNGKNGSLAALRNLTDDLVSRDGEIVELLNKLTKANDDLRESEAMNLSLLEGSPVCNKIITNDFKLKYMSSAGIKDLKISDINTCYGNEYPPKFFCQVSRNAIIKKLKVALTGVVSEVECATHTTEGDELWYLHTFVPVFDDNNKVKYIIGSSINVTKRRNIQDKLEERVKELDRLYKTCKSEGSVNDK